MSTAVDVADLLSSSRLSELVTRSERNIRRSRALVEAADAIVRSGRRIRRPQFAGGTDEASAAPGSYGNERVVRTWAKVKAGSLPTEGARRRWVGPGRGEHCNGCGDLISARETEFEIDFRNALLLRFHAECLRAWESVDGRRR
jgi:hypothetical protein